MTQETMASPDSLEGCSHEKDLYVVYPVHVQHFMERFGLTALEMCSALGFPSVQEWYRLQKNPDQRVKNTNICQLLRAYNEHPEWLKIKRLEFAKVAQRIRDVLASAGAKPAEIDFALSQVFDKSATVLKDWIDGVNDPDQAARRVSALIMELDDDDLLEYIRDARLSGIPQIEGRDVHVYTTPQGEKRYTYQGDEGVYTNSEIARRAPLPGRRRSAKDYPPAMSTPAMRPAHDTGASSSSEDDLEAIPKRMSSKPAMPWGRS